MGRRESSTGVGRSGSCLQSEVLMASPTPCMPSSSFAFPVQKYVYPPFGSANRTFLGESCLTEGDNVNLVFTKFPRDQGSPPFGPRRGIPVQEGAHVPCAESHLLFLLILTYRF